MSFDYYLLFFFCKMSSTYFLLYSFNEKLRIDLTFPFSNNYNILQLDTTVKGNDGNLYESSWRHKGKRLLGYKKNPNDDYVVTDLTIITEDKDVPDEYAGVLITKDTRKSYFYQIALQVYNNII